MPTDGEFEEPAARLFACEPLARDNGLKPTQAGDFVAWRGGMHCEDALASSPGRCFPDRPVMADSSFGRRRLVLDRFLHEPGRELTDERRWLSGSGRLQGPRRGHLRARPVQRQPLRVVARGQARHREPGRLVEVLLRQVLDLLYVLSLRAPDREWNADRQ